MKRVDMIPAWLPDEIEELTSYTNEREFIDKMDFIHASNEMELELFPFSIQIEFNHIMRPDDYSKLREL